MIPRWYVWCVGYGKRAHTSSACNIKISEMKQRYSNYRSLSIMSPFIIIDSACTLDKQGSHSYYLWLNIIAVLKCNGNLSLLYMYLHVIINFNGQTLTGEPKKL